MNVIGGRQDRTVRTAALLAVLALMALFAATLGGGFIATAQSPDGAMSDPALSSDDAGTIVVSWTIPSPTPSDYRIDYAKSGEDYTSWRVDEGHAYPAGTETTVTIEGLDPGVEYKVRMRARYRTGGHADGPWSGPWTGDVLITVAAGGDGVVIIDPDEEPLIAEEQSGDEVLVSNLSLAGTSVVSIQLDDGQEYRQSFTTGPNPAGYRVSSVTLRMRADFGVTVPAAPGTFNPVVSVIPSDSEEPLFTFTAPTGFSESMIHVFREVTFTAPSDAVLKAGTTYRLWLTNDQSSLHLFNVPGDDDESDHGWTIADGGERFRNGSWDAQTSSPLMAISGELIPETLISNLGQTPDSTATASDSSDAAQSFTTGPGLAGLGYRFDGIEVAASLETAGESPAPRVALHTDEGGAPGPRLFSLTPANTFPGTTTLAEYLLTAPPGAILDPATTYWVVFTNTASDDFLLSTTATGDEDQDPEPQDGWSLGDAHQVRSGDPPQWATRSQSIRVIVHGAPDWFTDEPADQDLPGALRFRTSGYKTNGVVTPGTASVGDLTAGQDTRAGGTGDIWRLDTRPGRQYSLEVVFGVLPNIDTGGSAWTVFHDPGTGSSGTCCQADHSRDDEITMLFFQHPSDRPDRRLFVDIAAFDMLNTGSATYNGAYALHLTDVTGTERVVTNLYLSDPDDYTADLTPTNRLAVSFNTGSHPAGYSLDRLMAYIRPQSDGDAATFPLFGLHTDNSGVPAEPETCIFGSPGVVRDWPDGRRRPALYLPGDCASQTLAANTTYWISMPVNSGVAGTFRTNKVDGDQLNTEHAYGSGWTIGNATATGNGATWGTSDTTFQLPIEIWATRK